MSRFALLAFLFPLIAHAGDRVGNGGGLWACTSPNGTFQSGTLVDLFEARSEFQLFVPDPTLVQTPNEILQARKAWVAQQLPAFSSLMAPYFVRIEKNLLLVDAQLQVIDDANFRVLPLASTCPGRWDYVQFANFTAYGTILIRKDFWESAVIASLDKAALLVHESVYLMLRERDGDLNSVRAREITGLLFSNLASAEISARIDAILKAVPLAPTAPQPTGNAVQWACRVTNDAMYHTYLGLGGIKVEAEFDAVKSCEAGDPNFRNSCSAQPAECAPIQTPTAKTGCLIKNSATFESFIGKGRNDVEAKAVGLKACEAGVPNYRNSCAVIECSN